jgi:hypothetical protein
VACLERLQDSLGDLNNIAVNGKLSKQLVEGENAVAVRPDGRTKRSSPSVVYPAARRREFTSAQRGRASLCRVCQIKAILGLIFVQPFIAHLDLGLITVLADGVTAATPSGASLFGCPLARANSHG